jgi:hypothetical protein
VDLFKPHLRALTVGSWLLLPAVGCLPIDRAPVESTAAFTAALAQADRVTATEARPLLAGAARVTMTPPGSPPLAGYGNRLGRASRGVHDDVYARALALRAGDQTVVLVSLDLLAVTDDMVTAVQARIRREVRLAPESLIVAATHTHSGFGAVARRVWESFAAGEYDETVFRFLADRAAAAAVNAVRDLAPAELAWGEATAPERIVNRMIPGGYRDPSIPFFAVRRPDGTAVAVVVNFSAHATVLKADNFRLSGDFPGATARALEERGVVALYTAGAVADQTGAAPSAPDRFAAMEAMGRDLAERVQTVWSGLPAKAWSDRVSLAAWRLSLTLPPPQVKVSPHRRAPGFVGDLMFDRRTTLAIAVIGEGVLIGVPCDLSAEIGASWKTEARRLDRRGVIIGFANDYVGYVIPHQYYETSHYEARMSFNGPYLDRYFTAVVSRALTRLGAFSPALAEAR